MKKLAILTAITCASMSSAMAQTRLQPYTDASRQTDPPGNTVTGWLGIVVSKESQKPAFIKGHPGTRTSSCRWPQSRRSNSGYRGHIHR